MHIVFSIGLEHPSSSTLSNGAHNVRLKNAVSKLFNLNQYDTQFCRYMIDQKAIKVTNGGMSVVSSFPDAL
jgi:hypothetical protein